jgi:hypothetical protein
VFDGTFGPLGLIAVWIEDGAPADTAVTANLTWRMIETVDERYRVSVRLQDLDGWTWAQTDDWLLDGRNWPTDRWHMGDSATSYHILPLPPGTPPLTYVVLIEVYAPDSSTGARYLDVLDDAGSPAGRSYGTNTIRLGAALGVCCDPYGAAPELPAPPDPLTVDGLVLQAATLDRRAASRGQPVFVTLRWRAETAPLPDLRPVLELRQDGIAVASYSDAPAAGRYPTNIWHAGEVILDHRRLVVPTTARAGAADVTLCLKERCTVLGQVQVTDEQHFFEPPPMSNEVHVRFGDVAELLGYDLAPPPHSSDRPITVTLYWQALEGASTGDITVFTHVLIPDAHLVAQHDGPPVGGTRPTAGWLPGEVIVDEHPMTFRESYAGPACIEVGLYDPATLERVPTADGADSVVLPSALSIEGP